MSKYLQVIGSLKGENGKSAYQYAQDGGYTGTEAEFAEKLAAEIPEAYTLPIASSTKLGGVQPTEKTDAMTQEVGVDAGGALWTAPGGGGGESDLVEIASVTLSENVAEINLEFPEQNRELFVRTSLHVNDADGTLYKADDIAVDFYVNGQKTFIKTPLTKSSAPGPAIWYMKLIAGCTVGYAYLAWGFTARQPYANDWPRELESFTSIKIKPTGATCEIKKDSKVTVYGRA